MKYVLRTLLSVCCLTSAALAQSIEVKYDNGMAEPLVISTNDTVVVVFNAVNGVTVDSIRIAFKQAGQISVGLWRCTTDFATNFALGAPVVPVSSMTVAAKDTNATPTSEGTVKWVTKNVKSNNISLNTPLAVGAIVGATPAAPGVLVSKKPDLGAPYNSFYYLNSQSKWLIPTSGLSDILVFMIRLYYSGPTGVEGSTELTPDGFALEQNYPNPFNPETRIRYTIPSRTSVRLTVYDVLGRLITTLVDQEQAAGTHEVRWDGKNAQGHAVGTGAYFCRIEAGAFVATRTLTVVK